MSKERPIIKFERWEMQAIRDRDKTQFRKVVEHETPYWEVGDKGDGDKPRPYWPCYVHGLPEVVDMPCPYGEPGDRFRVGWDGWKTNTTRLIASVWAEPLNMISSRDALAEGIERSEYWDPSEVESRPFNEKWWDDYHFWHHYPQLVFARHWESIHGLGSFDDRWVWVVEFGLDLRKRRRTHESTR